MGCLVGQVILFGIFLVLFGFILILEVKSLVVSLFKLKSNARDTA